MVKMCISYAWLSMIGHIGKVSNMHVKEPSLKEILNIELGSVRIQILHINIKGSNGLI